MIESALRWYELFTGTLCGMGFELNPYDRCVANKMIDGSQCTVGWYVDDNKVSHVNDEVNSMIVDAIEKHFGKLARTMGNKHTFLGMVIEMISKGKILVSTPQHVEEAIEGLGEEVHGTAVNPAKSKIFSVDHESPKLTGNKKETFHLVRAKVLWISQRSRPDLDTTVSFLCTQVKEPTEEDWRKVTQSNMFPKSNKRRKTNHRHGRPMVIKNMDRRVLRSTQEHVRAHRQWHVIRMGTSTCKGNKAEVKFKEFDRNRGYCSQRVHSVQNMVNKLYGSTRIQVQGQGAVSR